jgi:hypothetical protein
MGWIEHRLVGQREHACPDPYPRDIAEALIAFHASSGMPMHPDVHAACVVSLLPDEISPFRG